MKKKHKKRKILTVGKNLPGLVEGGPELGLRAGVHRLVRLLWPEETTDLADVHAQGLVRVELLRIDLHRRQGVENAVSVSRDAKSFEIHDDALADVDHLPRMFLVLPL